MAGMAYIPTLPLSFADEDELRFQRITKRVLIVFLVLSVVVPWLPVFEISREKQEAVPPRIAKVLMEKQKKEVPKPPAPAQAKKAEPDKPTPKKDVIEPKKPTPPKPEPKVTPSVKERVAKVGLLAMRQELAEIRNLPPLKTITNPNVKLSTQGSKNDVHAQKPATRNVNKGSGGLENKVLAKDTVQTRLAQRQVTQVESSLAAIGDENRKGDERVNVRTIEEIRLVLERYKGSFNILYTKQLRRNPTLKGKVLFELIIEPSGAVSSAKVVESELKTPGLEHKFLIKLKSIDFGEKDVDTTIINYPLDFFPS